MITSYVYFLCFINLSHFHLLNFFHHQSLFPTVLNVIRQFTSKIKKGIQKSYCVVIKLALLFKPRNTSHSVSTLIRNEFSLFIVCLLPFNCVAIPVFGISKFAYYWSLSILFYNNNSALTYSYQCTIFLCIWRQNIVIIKF